MKACGIVGPVISLSGVLASYLIHRDWWSITRNAISDLGKIGLPYNWVMNYSLIIGGICLTLYGIWKVKEGIGKIGWALYTIGAIFLILIGIFPEGTGPHYEVSWGFFISMFLSIFFLSLATIKIGILIFIGGSLLAIWALKSFEGVAVAESISVLSFLVWHYLTVVREDA
ncbi:hypothetical protein PNA2_0777 [Pyrococcus sp. NA2]|uniref:DUF998 domain-containing protein n=1 Tax=Pyrococcus sp. (strain NA2) TaxID=342949 RepID=UPI000209AEE3|nr:DUF998 domain-containing protein [Pyrococcus sp. NA2]AEC51693.1 hypothetical protein PNA2_0777 [Pyrococcus sp. NA2]